MASQIWSDNSVHGTEPSDRGQPRVAVGTQPVDGEQGPPTVRGLVAPSVEVVERQPRRLIRPRVDGPTREISSAHHPLFGRSEAGPELRLLDLARGVHRQAGY